MPTSAGSSKQQDSSRKTSTFVLLTMPKPLTVWITINCRNVLKRWGYQTIWLASWEIYMQVKKQQLELDMELQTGCKLGKEYNKTVACHPAYLTYMQSQLSSVSVVFDSLWSHGLQYAGLPCPSPLPRAYSTHVQWLSDNIQPSYPLSSPSQPTFNHSQNQGLSQWVNSSHQVAKVLEFQLQHQRIFRTDFL